MMHDKNQLAVGTRVIAPNPDHYLRRYCGVIAGETVGVVTALSRLDEGDDGVLVSWGDGKPVRCDLRELEKLEERA